MSCRKLTLAVAVLLGTAGTLVAATPAVAATNVYVNCGSGSNSNAGDSTHPWLTVQHAVDSVSGTDYYIHIQNSTTWCHENVTIPASAAGTSGHPNAIVGSDPASTPVTPNYNAVLSASGSGTALTVNASYWSIHQFTVNGQFTYPDSAHTYTTSTSKSTVDTFKDGHNSSQGGSDDFQNTKLVYIGDDVSGVHNVTLYDMTLTDSGGECVRVRDLATTNIINNNLIQYCGLYATTNASYRYHNGEAIYFGTSPKSTNLDNYANDTSHGNVAHNNTEHVYGDECWEVKENAHDNVYYGNVCNASEEASGDNGSNMEIRGYNNISHDNTFSNSAGWGTRMASDSGTTTTGGNSVYNNSWDGYTDSGSKDYVSEGSGFTNPNTYCNNTGVNPTATFGTGAC